MLFSFTAYLLAAVGSQTAFGVAGADAAALRYGADCMSVAIPAMNAAATRQDSIALAERYENSPPDGDRNCGALLAGYLLGMTSTPAEDEWRVRRRALDLLNNAARSYANEPRLYLATGVLLYNGQSRDNAMRVLGRALDRRDREPAPLTPRETALIYYYQGMVHQDYWRDWRSYGQLKSTAAGQWHCGRMSAVVTETVTGDASDASWLFPVNQICAARFDEQMETYFEPWRDMKTDELKALEEAYKRAIETDPTLAEAAAALLGEYVYLENWDKAEEVARAVLAAAYEDYRPYTYLGLVLHETGRDSLAQIEFAKSFIYMPDSVMSIYEDVDHLLIPAQKEWLDQAEGMMVARFKNAFWTALDPLFLTPENERKLAHYSRVTAADLLFSSPALREHGWHSFAGQIWIRYGRPREMRELPLFTGRAVFWDYEWGGTPQPDVTFERGTALRSYRPTELAVEYSNLLGRHKPQDPGVLASLDSIFPMDYQVVRTMDREGGAQLLIYAEWPDGVDDDARAGLFLLDPSYQPVAQWKGGKPERPGIGADLTGLSLGRQYLLEVEVWDVERKLLGRVRDTVTTLSPNDSTLSLSDLLLASRIRPARGDREPTSRSDLSIDVLYGQTLPWGRPLAFFWEIYGLEADSEGDAEYEVSVELRDSNRRPMLANLLARVGLRGNQPPVSTISYGSKRRIANRRIVEWLELASEVEPGAYTVSVTVTDRRTGVSVTGERSVTVK